MAKALGDTKSAALLERNLKQETAALRKVSTIAKRLAADSSKVAAAA